MVTLYDTAWRSDLGWVEPRQSRRMEGAVRALLRGDPEIVTISESAGAELTAYLRLDPARVHVTPLAADPIFSRPVAAEAIAAARARYGVQAPYVDRARHARAAQEPGQPRPGDAARRRACTPTSSSCSSGGRATGTRISTRRCGPGGSDRTRWLGSVPDADAAALVQGAAALAFPSLHEGFGLPAIEGMAAGVPVIASDIPVMREICGDAALLVDTTKPELLAEALRWAVTDRGARDVAARGRARAAQFTWRRCAEGTLAAYRALLERTS